MKSTTSKTPATTASLIRTYLSRRKNPATLQEVTNFVAKRANVADSTIRRELTRMCTNGTAINKNSGVRGSAAYLLS